MGNLVLSRKTNQSFVIEINEKKCTVEIFELNKRTGEVKVGIRAPKEFSILRTEVRKED